MHCDRSQLLLYRWHRKNKPPSSPIPSPHHKDVSTPTHTSFVQVFVNKQIFSTAALRSCQVAFAAFHFTITFLLLYLVSRPRIALFVPKRIDPLDVLPLALSMILNVVLPNASLAFSSIQFYQVVRVLVTPVTALLNWWLYGISFPMRAAWTLLPVCAGVAVLSWFDTKGGAVQGKGTSFLGVGFALAGVVASALYGVWIKAFHSKLRCDSSQLLMAQSPVAVGVMLYVVPFSDDITAFRSVGGGSWGLILLVSSSLPSTLCSCERKL